MPETKFTPIKFTKGDATRIAHTPADAVLLRFNGWREIKKSKASSTTDK